MKDGERARRGEREDSIRLSGKYRTDIGGACAGRFEGATSEGLSGYHTRDDRNERRRSEREAARGTLSRVARTQMTGFLEQRFRITNSRGVVRCDLLESPGRSTRAARCAPHLAHVRSLGVRCLLPRPSSRHLAPFSLTPLPQPHHILPNRLRFSLLAVAAMLIPRTASAPPLGRQPSSGRCKRAGR
ncbi:hypothetical protein [Haladaptatus halobius]|uniref:hypothetical protein n=1 Tax=Haladaptatus halobius TaxID=2884875 RepID=UPI001D0A4DA9|nr:hypothetical protein [Haladaptatus halobius]